MKENKNRLKDKYLDVMKRTTKKKKNIKRFSGLKVKNIGKLIFLCDICFIFYYQKYKMILISL